MKIVATTSLPAVDRPNADRWNAAPSRQKIIRACKKTLLTEIDISSEMQQNCILPSLIYDIYFIFDSFDQFEGDFLNQ